MAAEPAPADLLVRDAVLVATVDGDDRELPGGWVAISDGLVSAVGASTDPVPAAAAVLDAAGCLVTPGLINTHHHISQNLTRSYRPALDRQVSLARMEESRSWWRPEVYQAFLASAAGSPVSSVEAA